MPQREFVLRDVTPLLRGEAERPSAEGAPARERFQSLGRRLGDAGRVRGVSTNTLVGEVVARAAGVTDELIDGAGNPHPVEAVLAVKRAARWLVAGLDAQDRAVSLRRQRERGRILHEFGRTLAHEVRNRLGATETALHMLHDDHDHALDRHRIYALARGSMASAFETIDDIRAIATAVDPTQFPEVRPTPLNEIVRRCADAMQAPARSAGVELVISEVPGLPVDGGPARLVVRNLLDNAIKYASPEGPHRSVWIQGHRDDDQVVLTVRDNGIGIPPGQLERVLEWSARLSHDMPGDGLGLAIVSEALRQVGGTVDLESVVGRGTTVTVTLPIRAE